MNVFISKDPTPQIEKVCKKISKRTSPRRGVLQKLPAEMRDEFTEMFNNVRDQLEECCQMVISISWICGCVFKAMADESMENFCAKKHF